MLRDDWHGHRRGSTRGLIQRLQPGPPIRTIDERLGQVFQCLGLGDLLKQWPTALGDFGTEAPPGQAHDEQTLVLQSLRNTRLKALADPDPLDTGDIRHVLYPLKGLNFRPELFFQRFRQAQHPVDEAEQFQDVAPRPTASIEALGERQSGEPFATQDALYGQLLGDLKAILPSFAPPQQRLATSRILFRHAVNDFLGREAELDWLDSAWADGTNVIAIIAWGGVGKTALLCKWLQTRFVDRGWRDAAGSPDPLAWFDWSFYDQGTRAIAADGDKRIGSVGDFFEQALTFFGDPDPNRPGKGARLAALVQAQRSLFVLDGLEPLQYPPGSPQAGELLDPDLRDLITALAQHNPGLLVITSREAVKELAASHARSRQRDLEELARDTAIRLLRQFQITGTDQELAEACERFGCHALSLTLLGRFLCDAYGGDIRRIDQVDLHQADRATRPDRQRTAWKVLAAYEAWLDPASAALSAGSPTGSPLGWAARLLRRVTGRAAAPADPETIERQRTLAVLRLTDLFDRTADPGCLAALRQPPIRGLTDVLADLDPPGWRLLLKHLEQVRLIQTRPGADGAPGLDAHP